MPNHKDCLAGLSIRADPVRFTYGGPHEIHVAHLRPRESLAKVKRSRAAARGATRAGQRGGRGQGKVGGGWNGVASRQYLEMFFIQPKAKERTSCQPQH